MKLLHDEAAALPLAATGLDELAEALVTHELGTQQIHGVPEPGELPDGEPARDPPDPARPSHRPNEPPPLDEPAVPRLRPLEIA